MTTIEDLAQMTIEERVSTNSHGVPAPPSGAALDHELSLAIELNDLAKRPGWDQRTIDILQPYSPIELPGAAETGRIIRRTTDAANHMIGGWRELSAFVVNDMCADFFNLMLRYCLATNQQHADDLLDFIDGSGIGYLGAYTTRLKVTLEAAFDVKYFYRLRRPLVYAAQDKGVNLLGVANAYNPQHPSYCAGHQTKFSTAVEVLGTVFNLTDECYRDLLITAVVAGMGRCGSLIHFPCDQLASNYLVDLRDEYPLPVSPWT